MSNRFHKPTQSQTHAQFVDEAEVLPPDTPTPNTTYPWDAGRADVLKSFQLCRYFCCYDASLNSSSSS